MLAGVDRDGHALQDVQQPVVGQPDRPGDVGELEEAHPSQTIGSKSTLQSTCLPVPPGTGMNSSTRVARREALGDLHVLPVGQPQATARFSLLPSAATTQTLPACTVPWTAVIGTTTASAAVPLVISIGRAEPRNA